MGRFATIFIFLFFLKEGKFQYSLNCKENYYSPQNPFPGQMFLSVNVDNFQRATGDALDWLKVIDEENAATGKEKCSNSYSIEDCDAKASASYCYGETQFCFKASIQPEQFTEVITTHYFFDCESGSGITKFYYAFGILYDKSGDDDDAQYTEFSKFDADVEVVNLSIDSRQLNARVYMVERLRRANGGDFTPYLVAFYAHFEIPYADIINNKYCGKNEFVVDSPFPLQSYLFVNKFYTKRLQEMTWYQQVSEDEDETTGSAPCPDTLEVCDKDTQVSYCYEKSQFCFKPESGISIDLLLPVITTHGFYSCGETSISAEFYYALGVFIDDSSSSDTYPEFDADIEVVHNRPQLGGQTITIRMYIVHRLRKQNGSSELSNYKIVGYVRLKIGVPLEAPTPKPKSRFGIATRNSIHQLFNQTLLF